MSEELLRCRSRVAELERQLAELSRELEATNEGVLAVYSELDEAHVALTEKSRQVEEADRLKSDFLANMSHEIRTPMNAIIGLTEMLLRDPLNPSQKEALTLIHDAGQSLLSLINDILDFSKIEAGKLELEELEFSPGPLLLGATELLRAMAIDKQLDYELSLASDLPTLVRGDPNRVRQILLNLIGNAIKFTDAGGRVEVRAEAWSECGLEVRVKDSGRGIAPETLPRLFKPFVQEDGSTTRQHGGTGLGLSICKRLVEKMGGQIGVESQPGQGSTFWFTIPLTACQAPSQESLLSPGEITPLAGGRILVAEDHLANQAVARRQLESLGLQPVFVVNGEEAVAAARTGQYRLVLMDCQMPILSGYEATRQIREWEKEHGGHLPIVALTAGALAGDRARCLEAGMDDYLSKPVDLPALSRVLARWLPRGSEVDHSQLQLSYGAAHAAELAALFEQEAGAELAGLLEALRARDIPALRRHSHSLRGLSGVIFAQGLIDHCDRLRQAALAENWPALEAETAELERGFQEVLLSLRRYK